MNERPRMPLALITTIPRCVWERIINKKKTWGWLSERYRQPDHCTYPDALAGLMGCWSLIDAPWTRTRKRCFYCDYFRGREKINYERYCAMFAKGKMLT